MPVWHVGVLILIGEKPATSAWLVIISTSVVFLLSMATVANRLFFILIHLPRTSFILAHEFIIIAWSKIKILRLREGAEQSEGIHSVIIYVEVDLFRFD
jgi:hypothetical protein